MDKITLVSNDSIRLDRLTLGHWQTNCYLLTCLRTGESVVVDAPADAPRIIEALASTTPKYILITHGHGDHVGALASLRAALEVPIAARPTSALARIDIRLNDGDVITFGDVKIEVLHTPGHTPGSLCFRTSNILLAGDTLFPGGPGHTKTPEDFTRIVKSLTEKVFPLPDDTEVYPGHGERILLAKAKAEYAIFARKPRPPDLCGDVLWLA